jgi:hypothetical protein
MMYDDIYCYVFLDAEMNPQKQAVICGKPVLLFHNAEEGIILDKIYS